jgi:hypothetical protein
MHVEPRGRLRHPDANAATGFGAEEPVIDAVLDCYAGGVRTREHSHWAPRPSL